MKIVPSTATVTKHLCSCSSDREFVDEFIVEFIVVSSVIPSVCPQSRAIIFPLSSYKRRDLSVLETPARIFEPFIVVKWINEDSTTASPPSESEVLKELT